MRKNIELTEVQLGEFLEQFYQYFKTGYEFEEFLKIYLEKIGLDEVSVTQRSKDGGIDLKAIRNGIGGFSDADSVEYYVQAKRNKPDTTISVTKIRELKGTIPVGNKGIFITTAKFSNDAVVEANNDLSRPIILIDGKKLIESCIDNEIGFVFKPVFSKVAMDLLKVGSISQVENKVVKQEEKDIYDVVVERQITSNDIRARILVIPKQIVSLIPSKRETISIVFNGMEEKELKIDKGRRYLGGVTDLYKKSGLILEDGSYNPQKAVWKYEDGKIRVILKN